MLLIIPKVNSVQNIFVPAKNKLGSHIQEDVSQRPYTSRTDKKIQVIVKYFQIKLPGVMHDKRVFYLLIRLVQKQVLKLLGSQEVAMWLICSLKCTSPCPPPQSMVYPCKYLSGLVHIRSHPFFCFYDPLLSSYCFSNNIAVFKISWGALLLCSPYS